MRELSQHLVSLRSRIDVLNEEKDAAFEKFEAMGCELETSRQVNKFVFEDVGQVLGNAMLSRRNYD